MHYPYAASALMLVASAAHASMPKPCDVFTQKEAAALLGYPVKPGLDTGDGGCIYAGDGVTFHTRIDLQSFPSAKAASSDLDSVVTGPKPPGEPFSVAVPGLGDRSLFVNNTHGDFILYTAYRNMTVQITYGTSRDFDTPSRHALLLQQMKVFLSRL